MAISWYDSRPPPTLEFALHLDTQHHSFINDFWQVQTNNHDTRVAGKGKGKQPSSIPMSAAVQPDEVEFDGDDRMCAVCPEEFENGDRVLRIVCRHIFHVNCWHDFMVSSGDGPERCPSCRGSGRVIARFRFVEAPVHVYVPPPAGTPPTVHVLSPSTSNQSFLQSVTSVLPWNVAPGSKQPVGYYHGTTQLPNNQPSIMLDIGAWTNASGKSNARSIASLAVAGGYPPKKCRMVEPLAIMGVGDGIQLCK